MEIGYNEATNNPNKVKVVHFDPHVHGRRMPMKSILLREASRRMCGGVLEPNTNPHLLTCEDVERDVAEANELTPGCKWSGSIYLTPNTSIDEVVKAWQKGLIAHVKWYPPHGSTHSGQSVQAQDLLVKNGPTGKLLRAMAEAGIPLKNHSEVVEWGGKKIEPDDRERVYFKEIQPRLVDAHPKLRQVLAHISTEEAVEYAEKNGNPDNRMFEVTCQHLAFNSNIRYDGGFVVADHHCLPVVKSQSDLEALHRLIKKLPRYLMAASDMAAHGTKGKYGFLGFGGFYTYHCSLELYIEMFEQLDVLRYAEMFLYGNAKRFHGKVVPDDPKPITLVREQWTVDARVSCEEDEMTPFGFHPDPQSRYPFQWKIAS